MPTVFNCWWLIWHSTDTCFMCRGNMPCTTKLTNELYCNCLAAGGQDKSSIKKHMCHTWITCLSLPALLEALQQKSWTHVAQIYWCMLLTQPAGLWHQWSCHCHSLSPKMVQRHMHLTFDVAAGSKLLCYTRFAKVSQFDHQKLQDMFWSCWLWQMTGQSTLEVVDTCNCWQVVPNRLVAPQHMPAERRGQQSACACCLFGQTLGKCHPTSHWSHNAGSVPNTRWQMMNMEAPSNTDHAL